MKTTVMICLIAGLMCVSCQKNNQNKRYLITKNSVGNLTKDTQVWQLDSIFSQDSVVNKNTSARFSGGNEIMVYGKGDTALLRLQPVKKFDSTSTIGNIEVLDTLYKTKKGLGRGSSFKALKSDYQISRIENTLGAALIFVDEINAYVSVKKKDIRDAGGMDEQIKTEQVKNDAKIAHFWLGWE